VTELLSAMSVTLERLSERVERLEVFLQSMESRLRARQVDPATSGAGGGAAAKGGATDAPASDPAAAKRPKSVSDAITRRPPADGH
jgi:hypothetical protein